MSEALAKQQTGIAVPEGSWGSEGASSKDMQIPRINLMQDLSKFVKSGQAKAGQIVDSTTGEVIGGPDKKTEIIPILIYSEFLLYDVVEQGGKRKEIYKGKLLCDKSNENLPSEAVVDGQAIRRVRQINVLCLRPERLDDLPFLISFKKTSTQGGRKLSTHFQSCAMKGAPAAKTVFNLTSRSETRDSNQFYTMDVEMGRQATAEEVAKAYFWYQTWTAGKAKAVEEQEEQVPF